ncbi:RuvB-like protein 2 (nucleomorph) [Cryptomonas paramecium]|uniref:RuvB-like helicase n=1 Tax=Cryptomonas paramaecium TaxID=2898 RepID=F2HIF8_9CRYP|nr:RuvB-like protein 2 [Cryptomonas paramecium]AEA39082.1 RuvB-like protein 2 [Cryptomonas paramecium]|mmetsp:Transcript_37353/g.99450  ORF Transcript_37353/g.99450 Transcript_37353/m.99450 type:complete len:437 (+) Transcript_37353:12790-14100(+)
MRILKNFERKQTVYSDVFYSHIQGIGMKSIFKSNYFFQGLVGQLHVRKSIKMILDINYNFKYENINFMFLNSSSSIKTSLSIGIAMSLRKDLPFIMITGAELSLNEISKIENLTQLSRQAVCIKFYNNDTTIRGKVVDIILNNKINRSYDLFYAKMILKFDKLQFTYNLSRTMYMKIIRKMVKKGDFISVNRKQNSVSKSFFKFENLNEKNKSMYKKMRRQEINEFYISLHELDCLNSDGKHTFSKFFTTNDKENFCEIREKINKILNKWKKYRKIKVIRGIFLLDNINFLDVLLVNYLFKLTESPDSPCVITFAPDIAKKTNKQDVSLASYIPFEFLDKFITIQIAPCSLNEAKNVLFMKIKKEAVEITKQACELLLKIAVECGVKHAVYIIFLTITNSNYNFTKINSCKIRISFLSFIDKEILVKYTEKKNKLI